MCIFYPYFVEFKLGKYLANQTLAAVAAANRNCLQETSLIIKNRKHEGVKYELCFKSTVNYNIAYFA